MNITSLTTRQNYVRLAASICVVSLLSGCGLFQATHTHNDTAAATTTDNAELDQTTPEEDNNFIARMNEDVQFGSSASTEDPATRSSRIGIFGELVSNQSLDQSQTDGARNITQITFATEGYIVDPETDASGKRIVFSSTMHHNNEDIYLRATHGRTATQLTNDPARDVMPAFSPDGSKVAFASNRAGNWDIYILDLSGSGVPRQVSNTPAHELHPSWSPDGSMLVFSRLGSQSGRWEMWTSGLDPQSTQRFLDYGMFPVWNPDPASPKILFQRARQRSSRLYSIWTIDYVGGEAMYPTEIVSASNAAALNPSWSPDGSRIVFSTVLHPDESPDPMAQAADVWVINLDGTSRARLTQGDYANHQPFWSPDGTVFFVSNRSGTDNLWSVHTDAVDWMNEQSTGSAVAGVDTAAEAMTP